MKIGKGGLVFAGALLLLGALIAFASVSSGEPQRMLYTVAQTQQGTVLPAELAGDVAEGLPQLGCDDKLHRDAAVVEPLQPLDLAGLQSGNVSHKVADRSTS